MPILHVSVTQSKCKQPLTHDLEIHMRKKCLVGFFLFVFYSDSRVICESHQCPRAENNLTAVPENSRE